MLNLFFPSDSYQLLSFRERFWLLVNRHQTTIIGLLVAIAAGAIIGVATPTLSRQNSYRLAMIVSGVALLLGILITRQPKRILIIGFVLAIPFNLRFTPFIDELAYHAGGAPPEVLIYLYDLPLVGLVVLWVRDILLFRKAIRITAIDLFALLFILWSAVSLFVVDPELVGYPVAEVLRIAKIFVAGHIIGTFITSKARLLDVTFALFAGLIVQTAFSVMQYFLNVDLSALGGFTVGSVNRVSGTIGWPNTFGAWIATILAIAIGYWVCRAFDRWNPAVVPLMMLGAIPLLTSFSRGAWVAIAVAVVVIYGLAAIGRWLRPSDLLRLLLIGVVAAVAGLYFADEITQRAALDTVSVRYDLNAIALRMVEDEPITGLGSNMFVQVMRPYDPTGVATYFAEPVHNIYLLIAAENGLVGITLFALLNLAAFVMGLRVILSNDRLIGATGVAYLGALVVILVSNLADVHLKFDPIMTLYFVILAVIVAAHRMTVDWRLARDNGLDG